MENKSRIIRKTFVESESIDNIKLSDFKNSININFKEPLIVCFYGEDKGSMYTLQTFVSVADSVEGLKFGVVNLDLEKEILKRFEDLNDEDNPYYWARYIEKPFILTYRGGFPQAFYNGTMDDRILQDYSENLAPLKGYKEHKIASLDLKYDKNVYLRTKMNF